MKVRFNNRQKLPTVPLSSLKNKQLFGVMTEGRFKAYQKIWNCSSGVGVYEFNMFTFRKSNWQVVSPESQVYPIRISAVSPMSEAELNPPKKKRKKKVRPVLRRGRVIPEPMNG